MVLDPRNQVCLKGVRCEVFFWCYRKYPIGKRRNIFKPPSLWFQPLVFGWLTKLRHSLQMFIHSRNQFTIFPFGTKKTIVFAFNYLSIFILTILIKKTMCIYTHLGLTKKQTTPTRYHNKSELPARLCKNRFRGSFFWNTQTTRVRKTINEAIPGHLFTHKTGASQGTISNLVFNWVAVVWCPEAWCCLVGSTKVFQLGNQLYWNSVMFF